jgi:hypothetical protein
LFQYWSECFAKERRDGVSDLGGDFGFASAKLKRVVKALQSGCFAWRDRAIVDGVDALT